MLIGSKQDFLAAQRGKALARQERDRQIKKGIYQTAVAMESETTDSFTKELKNMQEKALKAAQNRSETKIQIGGQEMSDKEWKKLLKRVDQAIAPDEEAETAEKDLSEKIKEFTK